MSLTQSQLVIIRTIHERMTEFTHQQMSQESILVNMMDIMPQLKSELLDTVPKKALELYCQGYEGFYQYLKLLESLAQTITEQKATY